MLVFLLPNFVSADIGPKPTMLFHIFYKTSNQISLLNGEQFQCKDQNCVNITLLGQYGPQRFACQENSCMSLVYDYLPYQKLILNFSDRERESNVFRTTNFNAQFNVTVTDSQLIVKEVTLITASNIAHKIDNGTYKIPSFIAALIITLILEFTVALIYLSVKKIPKHVLYSVAIGNIISLPIVWFVFPLVGTTLSVKFLAEIFAAVFEAYFIYWRNKKLISLKNALALSIIMNLVSWLLGGFILLFLPLFFYY